MSTPIELDEYAQKNLNELRATTAAIDELEAERDKARNVVRTFLMDHEADVGVVDGVPVVRLLTFDVGTIDLEQLRADEPFLARKYLRVRTQRNVKPLPVPVKDPA